MKLPMPQKKLGVYKLGRRLGKGGMGEVYLARDTSLERNVAVKILPLADDLVMVRRFQREARAVAKLNHPNIVQIYTVDIDSDPPYMAMEYVYGRSLDILIGEEGNLSWQRALTICGQVAAALHSAHQAGIIHRDIKPGNILIDMHNRAKVTDFGLAKTADAVLKLTDTAAVVGTPCYLSPEQCGVGEVVPASDIFALGTTMYEALTGRLPFDAETAVGLARQITTDDPPPLTEAVPDLPQPVTQFVETLMGRELEKRYQSCRQVLEDLTAMSKQQPLKHSSAIRGVVPAQQALIPKAESQEFNRLVDDMLADTESVVGKPVVLIEEEPASHWRTAALVAAAVAFLAIVGVAALVFRDRAGTPPPTPVVDQQPDVEETPVTQPQPPPPHPRQRPGQLQPGQHPPGFPPPHPPPRPGTQPGQRPGGMRPLHPPPHPPQGAQPPQGGVQQ